MPAPSNNQPVQPAVQQPGGTSAQVTPQPSPPADDPPQENPIKGFLEEFKQIFEFIEGLFSALETMLHPPTLGQVVDTVGKGIHDMVERTPELKAVETFVGTTVDGLEKTPLVQGVEVAFKPITDGIKASTAGLCDGIGHLFGAGPTHIDSSMPQGQGTSGVNKPAPAARGANGLNA